MATNNQELTAKIQSKAVATAEGKPTTVADQVRHALERMKGEMIAALPKHMTPDRMARIALTEIRTNPLLLECTAESLLAAVMKASQLGLEPGLLGHCYFVPFNTKYKDKDGVERWRKDVQFIPGYKGKIDLIRRSGQVSTINAVLVYANDDVLIDLGEQTIKHIYKFGTLRGKLVGVYGIAVMKDGSKHIEPMAIEDVEKVRAKSKSKDKGPWVTDYEEMVRKTVIHRMSKYLPMSIEVAQQLAEQDRVEFDDSPKPAIDLGELPQDPQAALEAHIIEEEKRELEPEGDMHLELDD